MRTAFLVLALVGLAGLAAIDLTHGSYRIGTAGGLLVIVNYLYFA